VNFRKSSDSLSVLADDIASRQHDFFAFIRGRLEKKKQVFRCVSDHLLAVPEGVVAIGVTRGRPLHSPVFESTLGLSLFLNDTSSRPGYLVLESDDKIHRILYDLREIDRRVRCVQTAVEPV